MKNILEVIDVTKKYENFILDNINLPVKKEVLWGLSVQTVLVRLP